MNLTVLNDIATQAVVSSLNLDNITRTIAHISIKTISKNWQEKLNQT